MSLSTAQLDNQEKLKRELQNVQEASKLEYLAAALLGRLLDVQIAVAKSGFQYGADAGPAGQQGRRFRVECKKYGDNSRLSERELLGEISQALARDEALEAWVLVATCSVSEQIQQSLNQYGERMGVPIVIIDWTDGELAPLAALCAFSPDVVEYEFSREAAVAARVLQPIAEQAIEKLRRALQSWCLGFEAIRTRSHEKLDRIWDLPRESKAAIGQNAAGGAQNKKVKRNAVHEALNAWWQDPVQCDAPAAVVGLEGVGKTWATLQWLIDSKDTQPVVLIIPASAVATVGNVSEMKQLLADSLHEMSGIRDREHWLRRLNRLLERPTDEGPVLTIFFDGLNQEPSVQWPRLLQVLQGETFVKRVRVIVSTRNHHFEEKLSGLRDLEDEAKQIDVNVYDTALGSELDQMLAFYNLAQADLHPDVIELARNPRLFKLVVRFREKLVEASQITVHRLLWEYGRDTFGKRAGSSFSEGEWQDRLKEVLVTAWLQSQNILDAHRQELADLAPNLPNALLDAVEHSDSLAHDSAIFWAVNALSKISRDDSAVFDTIVKRSCRWLSIVSCDSDTQSDRLKRHWSAIHATEHLVLAGEAEIEAARKLRLSGGAGDGDAFNKLLLLEIRDLDVQAQFDELIHADLESISVQFANVLRPPTPDDVDALIARYAGGPSKQQRNLLILLSIHPVELTDKAWSWVESFAKQQDENLRRFAFQMLTHADPVRFGRTLEADGWSWSPGEHYLVQDCGMDALIKATLALPLCQLAPRLAPWRLLEAVRQRGADPTEGTVRG